MSEFAKTMAFVTAAVVVTGAAAYINSSDRDVRRAQEVGQYVNEGIDIGAPKRMRIVKFDRETAAVREFEVAEVDGVWSIPSKEDYPADATRQMAEAATAVIDRKILRVAAEAAEGHAEFGVVDPLAPNLDSSATGVGTRVIMTDSGDDTLVDMIVGKTVKDAEGQRYVRRSNQDVVYVVELDPSSLSTDFSKWIEPDLLKLNPFDITKVFINDYSADLGFVLTPQGIQSRVNWDRRSEITLGYDSDEAKWNLVELKKFDPQQKKFVPAELAGDEEVNQDSLSKLRNGLDDLQIVDVVRKPDGLSADLKAGEDFLKDEKAFEDLIDKGFSPVAINGNDPEILSSEGEIVCTLRDGVEYVLRFGQLQVQTESAAADGEAAGGKANDPAAGASADGKAAEAGKDGGNLRRYLFVMARFNKDAVEKPKFKEPPSAPAGAEGELPEAGGGEPADNATGESASDEEGEAADPPTDSTDDANDAADDASQTDAAAAGEDAEAKADEKDDPEAERKKAEEENKRLEEEYQESLANGKKRVDELNERFGDWYYVISNDVFKQIHLGRDDVIKKKDAPKDEKSDAKAAEDNPLSGLPQLPGAAGATPTDEDAEDSTEGGAPAEESPAAPPQDDGGEETPGDDEGAEAGAAPAAATVDQPAAGASDSDSPDDRRADAAVEDEGGVEDEAITNE